MAPGSQPKQATLLTLWTTLSTLWALLFSGAREDPKLEEQKRLHISRGGAFGLTLLGPIFIVINLVSGHHLLALLNLVTTSVGALCLYFSHKGRSDLAALGICLALPPLFFYSGTTFGNGMEYILLLTMMGAIFMFNRPTLRVLLAALSGIGFLGARLVLFDSSAPEFPLGRYVANLTVFLLVYYCILEIFRSLNRNYQSAIEQNNRNLQQLTEELEKENATKEKIFRIVAHDVRGPLGNLTSTVNLLSDGDLSTGDFRSLLPQLQMELDNATFCLDTLLHWSSMQLNRIQPVYTSILPAKVWRETYRFNAEPFLRKKIALVGEIPENAVIATDKDLICIIIRNLLSNALKFTSQGGKVTFRVEADEQDRWKVSVTDTGLGITPERLRELDQPAHSGSTPGTGNERGLGLGLRICRDLLQVLDSRLNIESEPGRGSRFYFSLPAAELPEAESAAARDQSTQSATVEV